MNKHRMFVSLIVFIIAAGLFPAGLIASSNTNRDIMPIARADGQFLKCPSKVGDISLDWRNEGKGLIVEKPNGIRQAVCTYVVEYDNFNNPVWFASILVQWCEELPCDALAVPSGHWSKPVWVDGKWAFAAEQIVNNTVPKIADAAQDIQNLKMNLLAQVAELAAKKFDCDDQCKDPANSGINADHAIWDGASDYPECGCTCAKGWTMESQGCVSCEDSCEEMGDHYVYDPDLSYTNVCECRCEDGYESGWGDSGNQVCKKVICPANSTNVADLDASVEPSGDRKLDKHCYCDEGYIKSYDGCVPEGPLGNELIYVTPAYKEISGEQEIQYSLIKKFEGSYDTEIISNDLIEWKTVNCSSERSDGGAVGEINQKGLFSSKSIGTCKIVATMNGINYVTEVTVTCSQKEPGNLDRILSLYTQRIPHGIVLSYPNDPRYYVGSFGPGRANNMYSKANDIYKPFTCGGYQGQVLKFLHDIQYTPDECTLLSNYEFGPIEGACGMHHAVVIYPVGTDWKTQGTVLDPWPDQMPKWEHISIWEKKFYPAAGETFILGQAYPTQRVDASSLADYCNRADDAWMDFMDYAGNLINEPVGTIRSSAGTGGQFVRDTIGGILHCPVNLLITDSKGRRLGVLPDGSTVHEIPYAFILNDPESETENSWYFELDADSSNRYDLELTGIDSGSFKFLWASPKDKIIRDYEEQSIEKGEIVGITIDPEDTLAPLVFPDGSEILPTLVDITSPAASLNTGLTFESRSKPSGSNVQIPLTLKGVEERIGSMDIVLRYDPSILQAYEVIKGSLTSDSLFVSNIQAGTIMIGIADNDGFTGDGSIAYVRYNVIGTKGSSTPLEIIDLLSSRVVDFEDVSISTNDGIFTVTGEAESIGDCDGDGKVTAVDALCALQMSVGNIAEDMVMDINSDGKVTALDAMRILKLALENM